MKDSEYVYYCDEAFNRIQLAIQKGKPYDLLITDLSFDVDGNVQKIANGYELIRAVRTIQPEIMILVFTGEDRAANINKLYAQYKIDAYVRKAWHDIKELKRAFEALEEGKPIILMPRCKYSGRRIVLSLKLFDVTVIRLRH